MMNYKYLILLLMWMALIFYLSSIPHLGHGAEAHEWFKFNYFRESAHIIIYGILTFLMWYSIPKLDKNLSKKIVLCGFLAILFAISDEIHQRFVPGRCGNAEGVLFDFIGIAVVITWISRISHEEFIKVLKKTKSQFKNRRLKKSW